MFNQGREANRRKVMLILKQQNWKFIRSDKDIGFKGFNLQPPLYDGQMQGAVIQVDAYLFPQEIMAASVI